MIGDPQMGLASLRTSDRRALRSTGGCLPGSLSKFERIAR